jgi:Fic family protein
MPEEVERRWQGDPGAPGGRRDRASFTYQAFVPDPIADLDPGITFETAEAITQAERAIAELNSADSVAGLEAVGPLLLRSEAIASSRIEGYELSQRNLARALIDPRAARGTAKTVAANVTAMEEAIAIGERAGAITPSDVLAIHGTLMAGEPARVRPGAFRQEQNWIGGRLNSPLDARFIPPPEDRVEGLIADLLAFLERDDLPAVGQAAIAHAQFETIHPFVDGNGRVGRCLIHVVLRRAGLAERFVPPVSVVLAARPNSYVDGLVGFREGRVAAWCASFAGACERASRLSGELAEAVRAQQEEWRMRAGKPRRDSAAARIIDVLPAQPILSAATVRAAISASHQRALDGLKALAAAGVVRQITEGGYDRQFAADELFNLIEEYEERVAGHSTSVERDLPTEADSAAGEVYQ